VLLRGELRHAADGGEGPGVARPVMVHLSDAEIERLAQHLSNALRPAASPVSPASPMMSAAGVAEWWGIGRRWVYEHADELGARRLGSSCRPRLRFDPDVVAEYLRVEPAGFAWQSRYAANVADARRFRPRLASAAQQSYRRRATKKTAGAAR
jgi:hypothetical protein